MTFSTQVATMIDSIYAERSDCGSGADRESEGRVFVCRKRFFSCWLTIHLVF